ncbi:hypothetical protein [Salinivibrio costicola]|uniref:Uncharacterized protein n=1 Tax=Salinivibrio costicola subsp. alcaliphilus TaxID=272773 RepID=A0ABX3KRI0_SALCS|nr:hypothetical protein [Salinivibrio costicola]OOF33627.1 hypothetical protein BZJ21_09860 [Salinivibrio costicola subsp. alcaliphilus]
MAKALCKWRRGEVEANLSSLAIITTPPRVACSKCARVASEKGYVCRPISLVSGEEKKAKKAKKASDHAAKKAKKAKQKAAKKDKKGKADKKARKKAKSDKP